MSSALDTNLQYFNTFGLNAGSLYVMETAQFATKKLENVRAREEVIVTSTSLSEDARCKFYHLHSTKCDGKGIVCDKDSFCVPKTHKCKRRHVHTYFGLF